MTRVEVLALGPCEVDVGQLAGRGLDFMFYNTDFKQHFCQKYLRRQFRPRCISANAQKTLHVLIGVEKNKRPYLDRATFVTLYLRLMLTLWLLKSVIIIVAEQSLFLEPLLKAVG